MTQASWPELPYQEWKDTYATLHMWTQVVGKVALAQSPPLNHSWGIAMQLTPRGLATRTLKHGSRTFSIEFDFIVHEVVVRTSDGDRQALTLEPRSVADFYREFMALLTRMRLPVRIWPMPVELAAPVRFDLDVAHASYDRGHVERFWQVLQLVEHAFTAMRGEFVGKCSPVHFFWGAFDLAVTRFSGRRAPAREGPAFMREAYSHEVISHGFWPGNDASPEAILYGYAVPEPAGFKDAAVEPAETFYLKDLGEFVLPYAAVRKAASPSSAIAAFVRSTYDAGATLGGWDRASLEAAAAPPTLP